MFPVKLVLKQGWHLMMALVEGMSSHTPGLLTLECRKALAQLEKTSPGQKRSHEGSQGPRASSGDTDHVAPNRKSTGYCAV
jgi:hypothetical protein